MNWLKTSLTEIYGLFVEDAAFAIAIAVWLAVIWAVARLVPASTVWLALLLFGGLAVILVESATRDARRKRGRMTGQISGKVRE